MYQQDFVEELLKQKRTTKLYSVKESTLGID